MSDDNRMQQNSPETTSADNRMQQNSPETTSADNRMQQNSLETTLAQPAVGISDVSLENVDEILGSEQECIAKDTAYLETSETKTTGELKLKDHLSSEIGLTTTVDINQASLVAKNQGILVRISSECDTSDHDIKNSSLQNKKKKIQLKLTNYYASLSTNPPAQGDKQSCTPSTPHSSPIRNILNPKVDETGDTSEQCYKSKNSDVKDSEGSTNFSSQCSRSSSDNLERRFVLVNSVTDENKDSYPQTPEMLRKLLSKGKPCFSPHTSPGKVSPSRRKSIMHPLTCSPSSADYLERKYLDYSLSSPCNFSGEHALSKLNASLVPFTTDLFSDKFSSPSKSTCSDKNVKQQLFSSKRKQDDGEELTETARKIKNALLRSCGKKPEMRKRKTPFMVLKKFNKKRKKASMSNSFGETSQTERAPDEYEVEYLESHRVLEDNQCVFFVKWVGWDSCDNSWEPIDNLLNCQEKMVSYFEKLLRAGKHQEIEILRKNAALSGLRQSLSKASDQELKNLFVSYRSASGLKFPSPNKEFIEKTLQILSRQRSEEVSESLKGRLQHELLLQKLWAKRKSQLMALKEWELEINFLAQNSAMVAVENEFDLEGPPPNFSYINHYLPGTGIIIPNDPPFGCDCPGGCTENSQYCCGKESGFAYDHNGRIKVPLGTPIYECNNRCTCSIKCNNRVIQRGQHSRLCIFKTFNGCGWGVKTLEDIKKGSFITKYVGEVITAKEAAIRANSKSKFYLFDLDFNCDDSSPCPFTVDASSHGNISHFINHSCDPNLAIYAAWINCLDPNIPLLVLFAIKDIKKGDELCFSYSRTDTTRRRKGEVKCKCGAPNCRKYVF